MIDLDKQGIGDRRVIMREEVVKMAIKWKVTAAATAAVKAGIRRPPFWRGTLVLGTLVDNYLIESAVPEPQLLSAAAFCFISSIRLKSPAPTPQPQPNINWF